MSQFVREALFIGLKEGLKLSFTGVLVLSYFRNAGLGSLRMPFFAGIFSVFFGSFWVVSMPAGPEVRDLTVKMIGYSFGLFYLFSLGALFHSTGTNILGSFQRFAEKKMLLVPVVFLISLLYYVPDMAGSSLYVADLSFMSGSRTEIFLFASAGLLVSVPAVPFLLKRTERNARIRSLIGLPQVLLFLALIKLLAGGVRGFTELSLIPSVQAGLMKLIHDIVHQTFVMLMVPDHPILSTTTWIFIGVLFGHTFTLWLSLIILVLPLFLFIRKHFSEEASLPPGVPSGALKRLYIKSFRDIRLLKSVPVFAFLLLILSVWFMEKGESKASLYNPEPRPIFESGGMVTIPLDSPGQDLRDGNIHKFSLDVQGKIVRLLVLKKPDGAISLCLDACELCQPDGYAQGPEHVVCLYCRTPIPIETVGKPGGCNPIPLAALVTEKEIRVEVSEIESKWRTAGSAKSEATRPR